MMKLFVATLIITLALATANKGSKKDKDVVVWSKSPFGDFNKKQMCFRRHPASSPLGVSSKCHSLKIK
jgi:hypothetical protein